MDKALKTRILMENFNKYIISENNMDELELNKYARTLYSIFKKNGIQVNIVRKLKRVVNSSDGYDTNKPGVQIFVQNQSGQPILYCNIYKHTLIEKNIQDIIWKQINDSLPDNIEMTSEVGTGLNLYFKIKSENRSEVQNQKKY